MRGSSSCRNRAAASFRRHVSPTGLFKLQPTHLLVPRAACHVHSRSGVLALAYAPASKNKPAAIYATGASRQLVALDPATGQVLSTIDDVAKQSVSCLAISPGKHSCKGPAQPQIGHTHGTWHNWKAHPHRSLRCVHAYRRCVCGVLRQHCPCAVGPGGPGAPHQVHWTPGEQTGTWRFAQPQRMQLSAQPSC